MHSFEVHSNESACRKKVRLGLEQINRRSQSRAPVKKKKVRLGLEQVMGEIRGIM